MTNANLLDLYVPVCGCLKSPQECPNTVNSPSSGIPPRGFYTKGTKDSIKILIVGKNPGHVLDHEKPFYTGKSAQEIVMAQLDFAGQTFSTCNSTEARKNASLKFHRNLLRYFSYFLDVSSDDVFTHCAYTNVVKCQTVGEQDRLDKITINPCLMTHFQKEIEFFSPKVIVALGNEAYRALGCLDLGRPIIKLKHPSYYYRKEDEENVLMRLKIEIQKELGSVHCPNASPTGQPSYIIRDGKVLVPANVKIIRGCQVR